MFVYRLNIWDSEQFIKTSWILPLDLYYVVYSELYFSVPKIFVIFMWSIRNIKNAKSIYMEIQFINE